MTGNLLLKRIERWTESASQSIKSRGSITRRLSRRTEAAASYRAALELAATEPERRYLARRLAEVGGQAN